MARHQLDYFYGLVTVHVKGALIEAFLQACTREGTYITNVKHISPNEVEMTIRLKDWTIYRKLRKKYRCKIKIVNRKGIPFLYQRMITKKAVLAAFICGIFALLLLANTLWSVEIEGLPPELEATVESQLEEYGVNEGKLTIGMKDPNEVQRLLLEDIPDLLWIGVKKKGTSYQLYGVMKTRQDPDETTRPADLVAAKKGMITKMFITKGRPLVSVNEVVEKGTKLATGELEEDSDEYIEAEGEVIAETWYKAEVQVPSKQQLQLTDGEKSSSYALSIGSLRIPLWGWWNDDTKGARIEKDEKQWEVFGWELPFKFQVKNMYPEDSNMNERTSEQIIEQGTLTAKRTLIQQLSEEAEIIEEKVLHEREEHGKVKLILLFKVHENIAVTKYITQGD
ncbi:sporulation protein YqfD [Halobacillus shinanisalinarum]|uniref:Sporulation protein YqfD n=1 Tax=Halobacillus shinanisalinarum TaxID=2932258 RepID=A0ABY4H008_9BACI|nr:sporulation protein YqfD [Halobacillus shinanisalinarum]UOQ93776.1 sporulation protein YqfD [Halobacillus shinanisalinarum]